MNSDCKLRNYHHVEWRIRYVRFSIKEGGTYESLVKLFIMATTAIMRIHVPDLEKMKTWNAPKVEKIK